MNSSLPPPPGEPTDMSDLDPVRAELFFQKVRDEQNLSLAIAAGSLTGLAGAAAWAFVTARFNTKYSLIAVAIGFAVGLVMRMVGKGIDLGFSIAAAFIALLSVFVGDLFATCALVASESGRAFFEIVWNLNWDQTVDLVTASFSYIDLVFYAVAGYFAFRSATRRFTEEELAPLRRV